MITLVLFSEIVELAASVGLIASCVLLYRFFRGGIMGQSFIFFSAASILFFVDRSITTMISLNYLAKDPYTIVHLVMETIFVILLTGGFLQLYRNWMRVQHRVSVRNSEPVPQ
ncbi:MAG: hypothetical protein ABSE82_01890 [Nitrososphaerales archaeon]